MKKVKITSDGTPLGTKVTLDGHMIPGVIRIDFKPLTARTSPSVMLTLDIAELNMSIEDWEIKLLGKNKEQVVK